MTPAEFRRQWPRFVERHMEPARRRAEARLAAMLEKDAR